MAKREEFKDNNAKRNNAKKSTKRRPSKGKIYDNRNGKFCADMVSSASNDPKWYFKDSRILNDVASFSFSHPLGTNLHFNNYHLVNDKNENKIGASTIPGLMTLRLAITPGIAENAQSPVNLAATNIYSFVRYKNSGASNYDAPDLMLYLLAMDSIYACWNWLQRIYGFASTYSQRNKYMPTAYMAANNVDFDDVMENLADFRAYLNIKANEISAFCVPSVMTYNVRHSWLFSNIFKDSDTHKAQQYMYVPAWFYKYDETSSSKGGKLVPVTAVPDLGTAHTAYKVKDLMKMLNQMIEAVNYSEDIGIMSGDILKAYGEGGLFKLSSVDADYKVEPVHSSEVLWQIENMQPLYVGTTDISQFDIVQDPDTNFIKYGPILTDVIAPRNGGYLNFHHSDITPENVIVATRLKASTAISSTGDSTVITSVGSEFVTNGYIMTFMPDGTFDVDLEDYPNLKLRTVEIPYTSFPQAQGNPVKLWEYLSIISMYTAFDWAPELLIGVVDKSSQIPVSECVGVIRDWDNYTLLDNQDVEAMNLLALLSEFNVPN